MLGGVNWFVLFRAPTRYPTSPNEAETLSVPMPPSQVIAALEGLRSFEPRGRIEEGSVTTIVHSAAMTAGMSGRRTLGHWVCVRVRPDADGAAVDVAIKNKWWESSAWAREERAKRYARALAEVRTRLDLE